MIFCHIKTYVFDKILTYLFWQEWDQRNTVGQKYHILIPSTYLKGKKKSCVAKKQNPMLLVDVSNVG